MIMILHVILILLFLCSSSFAFELAELKTETAEELLLFFEAEDLVIATRHETPVSKAPAIATVITAREIRNMGARNLSDVLRKVPGIGTGISSIPVIRAVEIRGIRTLYSEKILIMLDGHRVNDAFNGSAVTHIDRLSVEHIKRVEIIRGPGSALYGANAFLAVINIVTKEAEDVNGLEVTAGGGSFDTQHFNLLFGHKINKLKVSGSFDYLDTEGPASFIEEDVIGNSGDTLEWQEKAEAGINISYGDFTLRGRYHENEEGPYIGTVSALNDESVLRFGTLAYLDLAWDRSFEDGIDLTARLYGDHSDFENYFELFPEGYPGFPDGLRGSPQVKQRIIGGEVAVNYRWTGHLLTAGFTYENERVYDVRRFTNYNPLTFEPLGSFQEVTDRWNFNEELERDVWAVYGQDVWNITDKVVLTAGVRYDHYSDFGGTTNPRAGFVWEFMKDTSLKLLYGSAFRAPSFSDLGLMNNPSNIGNPDLEPEKINTYEAGLEHRFLERYTARVSYFYNDITDLIVIGDKPSPTEPAPLDNRGRAEIDGIEAELLFDFGNDNYGYVNYSYQHPLDGDTGQRLPDVSAHKANATLNLAPWKYLNTNIGITWVGKRYRDNRDTRDDLPAETLVDLTLIAKNFYKTLEIRGSVYNLFDEYYLDPSPYPGQVHNDFPTNKRMLLVEARYTF